MPQSYAGNLSDHRQTEKCRYPSVNDASLYIMETVLLIDTENIWTATSLVNTVELPTVCIHGRGNNASYK